MNVNHFRRLFDYNYWAHERVWTCVMQLSDEQFGRDHDYSSGSVHKQVVHTMGVEWVWLQRVHGISPEAVPKRYLFPTRESIRTNWDQVEIDWYTYIDGLTDAQLDEPVSYNYIGDTEVHTTPLWELLMQVINHGTDHRAQTLALIHQLGGATVEQDIAIYSWERRLDGSAS
jgi:uncharacterized damage-inducible protein DinB